MQSPTIYAAQAYNLGSRHNCRVACGGPLMDLEQLRRETFAAHNAVEQSVPLMDEELDVDTYVECLLKLHGIIAAWEEWAAPNARRGSNHCWLPGAADSFSRSI